MGLSGIWIAWALSKTGGKLITIDIDEERHKQALKNFKEAGLSEDIDTRLADAHALVKTRGNSSNDPEAGEDVYSTRQHP